MTAKIQHRVRFPRITVHIFVFTHLRGRLRSTFIAMAFYMAAANPTGDDAHSRAKVDYVGIVRAEK